MRITAFPRCGWCHGLKRPVFYRGKRENRCSCDSDYRTPVEVRRDAVLEKYGNDPEAYTPAVLAELAKDGLFDVTTAFCPAGRLSMDETKAREAAQVLERRAVRELAQQAFQRMHAASGMETRSAIDAQRRGPKGDSPTVEDGDAQP